MSEMAEAIRELIEEKGFSEESVKQTVENAIKAAYKKTFGTADNCEVKFADDLSDVSVYSRKVIVDGVYDPVTEIELEDALKMSDECEVGDEILILIDPKTFERSAVSTGKQAAHQGLSESQKTNLYNEFKDKIGEVIIGYYQREYNGNIYVDLGKVEGVLPKKYQSPREVYQKSDRIKAVVVDVKPISSGVQLVLSRTDPKFVQSTLELEVPEIEDKTVEIFKIVREAGYRTKIAVFSNKEEVDPVGACVGPKGVRIQNVIRELEGEKIDVLRYDPDPVVFIKNALSPAEVEKVLITDEEKRQALAIVNESQFSLAIGKQGQNVRLANRLCDWSIDVKTEEQAAEIDLSQFTARKAAEQLFSNSADEAQVEEPVSTISELSGVDANVAKALKDAGYDDIQDFVDAYEEGTLKVEGVTQEQLDEVNKIICDVVEFVEEENPEDSQQAEDESKDSSEEDDTAQDEDYFCPECGAKITLDMHKCPNCGVEFEFE
ncbi:transcription termination factor NusA [Treponema pectinovorum]|uniref:transcription termination factor NusA n=1 Tax=Treponema pectinovorum TaxID=164 RepID=UPI0011C81704|nr:transcription termination factor NusA [Treponema pectinovorum]